MTTTDQIENLYHTMNAKQIAWFMGLSHANVRRILSDRSIRDQKIQRRRETICKLWNRGTVEEIAQYMGCTTERVRYHANKLNLTQIKTR